MKLYWMSTPCHGHDWFVYAWDKEEAKELFEEAEGFQKGYSTAKYIKKIPKEHISKHNLLKASFAPNELLQELYLFLVGPEYPRLVLHEGEAFFEGKRSFFSWPPINLN